MPFIAANRSASGAASGRRTDYQPPPPPPPPPPPDEPPPPEPLLEPGALDAELTLLAREDPTLLTNSSGLLHGLFEPAYQVKP